MKRAITVAVAMAVLLCVAACNKSAEDTNKPVIIQGFNFTVDGEAKTPQGTLQLKPAAILGITVKYVDPDAGDEPDPAWYKYKWTVERINASAGAFDPNDYFIVSNENPCIWAAPDVTGFFRFTCEVYDRYFDLSRETVVVEVNTNREPVINSLEISNSSPYVNEEVTVTVDASDPDGNLPLEYVWQASGGYFTSESDGIAEWLSPSSGDFNITIIVKDQAGGSTSRVIPVKVQENHDPIIQGWDIEPSNSVLVNELVTITLNVTDEDNDSIEYNWSLDCGSFNNVNENIAVWRAPSEAMSCTVTCQVEDNKGGSDTADIIINVSEQ